MGKLGRYLKALGLAWRAVMHSRAGSWSESPAHELVGLIARYCHARRRSARLRALYFRLAAILKYRELVYISKLAFIKHLAGGRGIDDMRADIAIWQLQTRRDHPETPFHVPVHGIFAFDGAVQRPFDLLAPILSSQNFSSLSFIWTERRPCLDPDQFLPVRDRAATRQPGVGCGPNPSFTWAGQQPRLAPDLFLPVPGRAATRQPGVDYGPEPSAGPAVVREMERQGFSLLSGAVQAEAYRKVNDLLKAAAPRHLAVAVALPEDELGVCDEALGRWLEFFARVHARYPWTLFCVLNPTTLGARAAHTLADAGVLPVRCRGLDDLAAFAFPAKADIFLGELGVLGMVAATAAKPGIYFHPRTGDYHSSDRQQWFLTAPTPENTEPILTRLIDYCTRPEIRPSAEARTKTAPPAAAPVKERRNRQRRIGVRA
jgi:hypothetical protein